jgi:hypothetical protein
MRMPKSGLRKFFASQQRIPRLGEEAIGDFQVMVKGNPPMDWVERLLCWARVRREPVRARDTVSLGHLCKSALRCPAVHEHELGRGHEAASAGCVHAHAHGRGYGDLALPTCDGILDMSGESFMAAAPAERPRSSRKSVQPQVVHSALYL